jgi:CHAD domain-containing protein
MAVDRNQVRKPAKKLRKLVSKMDDQPTPDAVHRLRTHSRRFEAIFEALSLDDHGIPKSTLKDLGKLRKRAGKVRDMDVLTGYASTVHPQGEEDCYVRLLEHLGAERQKYAKRLFKQSKRLRPTLRKNLDRADSFLDKRLRGASNAPPARSFAADATARAMQLISELTAPQPLNRESLHPYRLKVKELRNVLLTTANATDCKFVDDLGMVKDTIGEWHDWEELVAIAGKLLRHGNRCKLLADLKLIVKRKFTQARTVAQRLNKKHPRPFDPPKKGVSSADTSSHAVWRAISALAG